MAIWGSMIGSEIAMIRPRPPPRRAISRPADLAASQNDCGPGVAPTLQPLAGSSQNGKAHDGSNAASSFPPHTADTRTSSRFCSVSTRTNNASTCPASVWSTAQAMP